MINRRITRAISRSSSSSSGRFKVTAESKKPFSASTSSISTTPNKKKKKVTFAEAEIIYRYHSAYSTIISGNSYCNNTMEECFKQHYPGISQKD